MIKGLLISKPMLKSNVFVYVEFLSLKPKFGMLECYSLKNKSINK